MTDPDARFQELESRLVELEIRSEERKADFESLDAFVRGYETRIKRLEAEVVALRRLLKEEPVEDMPPPEEDLPPHY